MRRFAEPEVASPTSHIRGQLRQHLVQTHAFSVFGDLSYPSLEPFDGFWRDRSPNHRTSRETESKKFPLLRPRHRALRLVHLELESARDEAFDALHHPLTRPLAANINVAVVRVSNKAMSPTL